MQEKTVLQSQLEDRDAYRGLKGGGALEAMIESVRKAPGAGQLEARVSAPDAQNALERVLGGKASLVSPNTAEAIVMQYGYPSLLVLKGDYEEPQNPEWKARLSPHRQAIRKVIRSVGRLDLKNHQSEKWAGTCWLVDDTTLVTNRHVAEIFCTFRQRPEIMSGVEVYVDFAEEFGSTEQFEHLIGSILHVEEPDSAVDLALMRLAKDTARSLGLEPIPLSTALARAEFIGTVGYPGNDLRNNPPDAFIRIFQGKFEKKRFAPGRIMNPAHSAEVFTHNCTTLGGNSGSTVMDIAAGAAIGLHFGGNALKQNYAVKAEYILDRMRNKGHPVRLPDPAANGLLHDKPCPSCGRGQAEPAERVRTDFADRDGYDGDFLGEGDLSVPMPMLNVLQAARAAETADKEMVLRYRHFSVVMNAERRLAFCAAANIDGNSLRNPRRPGRFTLDPRLSAELQTGEAMYRRNDFDRGHLVRRLDPCWGSDGDARQANQDSMFFPNIAPQHKDLNQKIWNDLEEHILQKVDDRNTRICVLVGCVFSDGDPEQRESGIRVPMEFWKVIVSTAETGRRRERQLQAQAFVMSQRNLVKPGDLEIVFGQGFETFQITVEQLERVTGLDFHKLKQADTFGIDERSRERMLRESIESARPALRQDAHMKPLRSLDDIVM